LLHQSTLSFPFLSDILISNSLVGGEYRCVNMYFNKSGLCKWVEDITLTIEVGEILFPNQTLRLGTLLRPGDLPI